MKNKDTRTVSEEEVNYPKTDKEWKAWKNRPMSKEKIMLYGGGLQPDKYNRTPALLAQYKKDLKNEQ